MRKGAGSRLFWELSLRGIPSLLILNDLCTILSKRVKAHISNSSLPQKTAHIVYLSRFLTGRAMLAMGT